VVRVGEVTTGEPVAEKLHLAVGLDGAGWHPAAWRAADARPKDLFTAGYWVDLVTEAERGLFDFVTIEDKFSLQSSLFLDQDDRTDQVRGRLDAVQIAARVAPLTRHIGLVPTATVTHTEPFHIAKAIATLDYVSNGRAGWRMQNSFFPREAAHFGRREIMPAGADPSDPAVVQLVTDHFDEAADFVEVARRLWDSWEDDAEIRDAATGRFIDREKLHYIDFEGRWFSVRGPSITPRPPQGQPVVTALGHQRIPWRFGARSTDVAYITPKSTAETAETVATIRAAQAEFGRAAETVHIFGDLVVFLEADASRAERRKAELDELDGAPMFSDAEIFAGAPGGLADLLLDRASAGLSGFRLRPGAIPHDLTTMVDLLVPELQRRGAFRGRYEAGTLRGLLGLPRPASRYARQP
jgi:alkanesulfonate monooxygenase SsuD/methylene tetrahydromethanopterin reductase-like flavin-dependent oxidoreductase (luciferase family)